MQGRWRTGDAPALYRRVSRYALIAALATVFWLAGDGTASATMPFTPSFDLSVSNANPGFRANTTTVHSVPVDNHLIDSINIFIPIQWQIAAGDTYPAGNVVGQVSGKADKGCNGSVDTLSPGNLINQALAPSDPSQAEWLAIIDGTWQLLFIVEETSQPREWQISVTLGNASMPAGMCSPQELKVTINGSASPSGAQVIANPTQAGMHTWDDGLLSLGGSHVAFISDNIVIGTDTDADGLANTVDNCPTIANPDQLNTDGDTLGNACDADDDNDGFSDAVEMSVGTNSLLDCGVDAWPADINNDGFSDITDVSALTGVFGLSVPSAPARYDIAPDPPDGFVDITDVSRMTALFGQSCGP
jgi:Thrombospondin type 3 repeat/Bacterial TSP3 repeat